MLFLCLVYSVSACGEGIFAPIWLSVIFTFAIVGALLSHICNDLLLLETLIVPWYEFVDRPSTTFIWTKC